MRQANVIVARNLIHGDGVIARLDHCNEWDYSLLIQHFKSDAARDGRFFSCPRESPLCKGWGVFVCLHFYMYLNRLFSFHSSARSSLKSWKINTKKRTGCRWGPSFRTWWWVFFPRAAPAPELVPRCRVLYQFLARPFKLEHFQWPFIVLYIYVFVIYNILLVVSKKTTKIALLAKVDFNVSGHLKWCLALSFIFR